MNFRVIAARLRRRLPAIFRTHTPNPDPASLPPPQTRLLLALLRGATLKSQRYLDGRKEYRLHPLRGAATPVAPDAVRALQGGGYLLSNQKFPAATLMLTARGRTTAQQAQDRSNASSTTTDRVTAP